MKSELILWDDVENSIFKKKINEKLSPFLRKDNFINGFEVMTKHFDLKIFFYIRSKTK